MSELSATITKKSAPRHANVRGLDPRSSPLSEEHDTSPGFCQCGCGEWVGFWEQTNRSCGRVKGEPKRYVKGHQHVRPLVERFWSEVDRRSPGECWPWVGYRDSFGYGVFKHRGVKLRANRVALELSGTDIPDGFMACHHCDQPECVNPDHLFVGSHRDNMDDMAGKGRAPRGERSGNAKLTAGQVAEIRESDLTAPPLARRFGVSETTIRAIRSKKLWGHL